MAKDIPSRIKRSKTTKLKPYDRQTSLLKRVADKVYDYLPSWLTLSSWATSSNAATSEGTVEPEAPSPLEDEDEDVCIQDDRQIREEELRDGAGTSRDNFSGNPDVSAYVRCPLPRTSVATAQPLANGDEQSDNSESSASTSGCSSLAPSQKKLRLLRGLPVTDEALVQIKKDLSGKTGFLGKRKKDASVLADLPDTSRGGNETPSSRTSLWSEDEGLLFPKRSTRPQPISSGSKPSFRVSSFGAPIPANGLSPFVGSPFYSGRTTFGGASSARNASRLSASGRGSSSYQNSRCVRPQVTVRERSSEDCISSTAKRILNTLERMTTPLSDVKKIPAEKNSVDFALSFTPSTYRRRVVSNERMSRMRRLGPPVDGIGTPYPTVVARLPHVSSIHEEGNRQVTSTAAASVSEDRPPSRKATIGKMTRPTKRRTHYSAKPEAEEESEVPELPNISLPALTSMPRFNFPSATVVTSTPVVPPHPSAPERREVPSSSRPQFSFASPIQHGTPATPASTRAASQGQPFVFSSPVIVTSSEEVPKKIAFAEKSLSNGSGSTERVLPLKAKVKSSEESFGPPGGGFKPAAELILGGSVMDILGGKTKKITEGDEKPKKDVEMDVTPVSTSGFGDKFKPPAGSWSCGTCSLSNRSEVVKCAACEAARPGEFGNKFAPAVGSWNCGTCMLPNRSAAVKCVACETPRPGVPGEATTLSPPATKPTSGFGNKFAPPSNSWECDACLVRNRADSTKCVACETPKSTAEKTAGVKDTFTGFKFGGFKTQTPSPAAFKFGMTTVANTPTTFKFGVAVSDKTSKDAPTADPTKLAGAGLGGSEVKFGDSEKKSDFSFESASKISVDGNGAKSKSEPLVTTDSAKPESAVSDDAATGFKAKDASADSKPVKTSVGSSIFKSAETSKEVAKTEAFKFGSTTTAEAPPSSTFVKSSPKKPATDFKFGVAAANEQAPSAGTGFKFGSNFKSESQPAATSTANAAASGFKFGQVKSTDSFQFGVPITSSAVSKTENVNIFSTITTSVKKQPNVDAAKSEETKPPEASAGKAFAFGQAANVFKSEETLPKATPSFHLPSVETTPTTGTASNYMFNFFAATKAETKPTAGAPVFTFGQAKTDSPAKTAGFTFADKPVVTTTSSIAASSVPASSTFVFAPAGFSVGDPKKTLKSEVGEVKIASVAPSFSFGSPSNQTQPIRPNFEFGATKSDPEAPPPVGGFKFSLGSTPTGAMTFGGFGTTAPTTSAAGSPGGFSFGSHAATAATSTAFGGPGTGASAFGGQSTFGVFGSPAALPFGQSQEAAVGSTAPGFRFTPAGTSSLFQFGAQQEPAPSVGGFNFGAAAPQPAAAPPNAGFNFSASTAVPSFNFGQQPASTTPFQFSPASDLQFNAAASPGAAQGAAGARKIRRAVRRTKK